ncbi:MAG TPA: DUF4912 domain-containing protein [Blastocatellia bacterium]|nr:DUF4912 domain-containing protein [Blastocatellia bacterium]
MFILRPSSPFRATDREQTVEAEEVDPSAHDEHFVDVGLPIPESYEVDIIRAMIQDPLRIFIYWEVREESLKALTRYFTPEDIETFEVVLRLFEVEGRNEAFFDVSHTGRYWMTVFPDREYEFEIGVRSPIHGYIPLVRSNRLRTPRGTVSPERDDDKQYRLNPPEFVEVVSASGFAPEQALDIKVAPVPGASAEPDLIAASARRLPETVREAITVAATGGALTAEMIEQIPEPLRSELMELLEEGDGRMASVGLAHYLPELLREALEDEREIIGDHIRPLHIMQRFHLGGSENVTRPVGEMRWPGLPRRPSSPDLIRGPK